MKAGPKVDQAHQGECVAQRLSAERTKSRLNKVMGSSAYKSMTIRNWATTTALLRLLEEAAAETD